MIQKLSFTGVQWNRQIEKCRKIYWKKRLREWRVLVMMILNLAIPLLPTVKIQ